MRRLLDIFTLMIFLTIPVIAGAHSVDLNSQQVSSLAEIIADIKNAQTVFIGEVHDH